MKLEQFLVLLLILAFLMGSVTLMTSFLGHGLFAVTASFQGFPCLVLANFVLQPVFRVSMLTSISHSGICCGSLMTTALVMLTWSSSTVTSFHSNWLICSCSYWSLGIGHPHCVLTSYSSIFCQNFFTSVMSGGVSIHIVFFPNSL